MTDDIHPATCVRALCRAMRLLAGRDPDEEPAAALRGADLTRADLRDADLTRATLVGADLSGAVLRDADLTRATLTRATLRGADLTRAVLRGATDIPDDAADRGAIVA